MPWYQLVGYLRAQMHLVSSLPQGSQLVDGVYWVPVAQVKRRLGHLGGRPQGQQEGEEGEKHRSPFWLFCQNIDGN